jgi:hypothetical protein
MQHLGNFMQHLGHFMQHFMQHFGQFMQHIINQAYAKRNMNSFTSLNALPKS